MTTRYAQFAAYNCWANERLCDAAAALPVSDYRADRGAFFRSVHGTLNHLLVGDRIWMRRFTGEGDAPTALDHFCNHQTHHRGQVHCLLTALAGNAPSLGLILFQRESGLGTRSIP